MEIIFMVWYCFRSLVYINEYHYLSMCYATHFLQSWAFSHHHVIAWLFAHVFSYLCFSCAFPSLYKYVCLTLHTSCRLGTSLRSFIFQSGFLLHIFSPAATSILYSLISRAHLSWLYFATSHLCPWCAGFGSYCERTWNTFDATVSEAQ